MKKNGQKFSKSLEGGHNGQNFEIPPKNGKNVIFGIFKVVGTRFRTSRTRSRGVLKSGKKGLKFSKSWEGGH